MYPRQHDLIQLLPSLCVGSYSEVLGLRNLMHDLGDTLTPPPLPHSNPCVGGPRKSLGLARSPQRPTIDRQGTQIHLQQTPSPATKKQAGAHMPQNHRKNTSPEKASQIAKNV